jgi:hypothetical protein
MYIYIFRWFKISFNQLKSLQHPIFSPGWTVKAPKLPGTPRSRVALVFNGWNLWFSCRSPNFFDMNSGMIMIDWDPEVCENLWKLTYVFAWMWFYLTKGGWCYLSLPASQYCNPNPAASPMPNQWRLGKWIGSRSWNFTLKMAKSREMLCCQNLDSNGSSTTNRTCGCG